MLKSKRIGALVAAFAASALVLSGCASSGSDGDEQQTGPAEEGAFPITIEHAYGETTLEQAPEGVIAWGWGSADAMLALDVVPAAMQQQAYGGNEEGVLPWAAEKISELGAEKPTVLETTTGEVPIEQVAAVDADVFLAPYSGLTQDEYDQLTGMGLQVIAYQGEAWTTPWRDVIATVADVLGMPAAGDELLARIDEQIQAKAAEHPEFEGKTVIHALDSQGTLFAYKEADARSEFTTGIGFELSPALEAIDTDEATFYTTVSPENVDQLEADVIVLYADTQEAMDAFLESEQGKLLPQHETGGIAQIVGVESVASMSPPTALSLPWGLDDYVDELAAAVAE